MFESYVFPKLETDSSILVLGGGTSRLPYQIYDMGYHNVTVVDFSVNARKAMEKQIDERPGLEYVISDVASFNPGKKYDFIIDKGCVDCVLADPVEPMAQLRRFLEAVRNVMKYIATWVSISFDDDRDEQMLETMPQLDISKYELPVKLQMQQLEKKFYVYEIKLK